jgi:putative membrane protein
MKLLLRILINAAALWITIVLLPGLEQTGGAFGLLVAAVIFGLVNALIRPVVRFFSLPITCVTLGLFTLVINAAMLGLTAWLAGGYLDFTGNMLQNTVTAFIAAIIISVISAVLSWLLPDDKKK